MKNGNCGGTLTDKMEEDLIIQVGDRITKLKVKRKVMRSGSGAHIILPKLMLDKVVCITFDEVKGCT